MGKYKRNKDKKKNRSKSITTSFSSKNIFNILVESIFSCILRPTWTRFQSLLRCTIYPIWGLNLFIRPGTLVNGYVFTLPCIYSAVILSQMTCKYVYYRQNILLIAILVGVFEKDS